MQWIRCTNRLNREKSEKRTEEITLTKQDPFSVLMLGVDEREGDSGRSDTMIVLTVNPNQNSIKMLSIPRDTTNGNSWSWYHG